MTVILTVNVDEELPFQPGDFGFPLRVKRNPELKGFGANHNAAVLITETAVSASSIPTSGYTTTPSSSCSKDCERGASASSLQKS